MASTNKIHTIYECKSNNRENDTVVADLKQPKFFRLFCVDCIRRWRNSSAAFGCCSICWDFVPFCIKVLIFATFAGVKVQAIKSAAAAVLPKHYSEDLHPETWRVFSSCGRKCVLTANPTIMVEPFLKNYLDVKVVLGTEISSLKGFATVLVGENKVVALNKAFGNQEMPHIGIGDRNTDIPFIDINPSLCS